MISARRHVQPDPWHASGSYAEPPADLRMAPSVGDSVYGYRLESTPEWAPSRRRKPFSWAQAGVQLFVVCALAFGCLQITRAIVSHLHKISILTANAAVMDRFYREAQDERRLLDHKVAIYSSPEGVEELARNNLDMVGPGEILVRIRR